MTSQISIYLCAFALREEKKEAGGGAGIVFTEKELRDAINKHSYSNPVPDRHLRMEAR